MSQFCACGVLSACAPQPPGVNGRLPATCQPLPAASASVEAPRVLNGTRLRADPLASPTSSVGLYFASPELAEEIPLATANAYSVRIVRNPTDDESTQVDVALDAGRPRRLAAPFASIALGSLVAADAALTPGLHWLFAAPVLGSGLVPRRAPGSARAAIARRFFVGQRAVAQAGPTGAVWLRKPEGTYNGPGAARDVLFDVYVFSATGAAQEQPYSVTLQGPQVSGELRYPSPFVVHAIPSGVFEVTVRTSSALPVFSRFTVNRELGEGSTP